MSLRVWSFLASELEAMADSLIELEYMTTSPKPEHESDP